ncbi:uncharacterized protein LOC119956204 isoform X2 [Scyliorhinus canicula]|uniref:uncharacterized protein LOC119956204 isoform X2 n=1 Tax=Scyliorhinus canicula TaxID=7830 RepID=UPI0018F2DA8E|nr:uncharacterized protein LOC119956204 isoform X2 [Scyliorhinus canicula]
MLHFLLPNNVTLGGKHIVCNCLMESFHMQSVLMMPVHRWRNSRRSTSSLICNPALLVDSLTFDRAPLGPSNKCPSFSPSNFQNPGMNSTTTITIPITPTPSNAPNSTENPTAGKTYWNLAIGLGVGLPILLLAGFLTVSIYIFRKKRKERKARNAVEKMADVSHSSMRLRNKSDDDVQAAVHHDEASAHQTPENPVYCNTINEAVYINVSETSSQSQELAPKHTEADSDHSANPRPDQDPETSEPVYENLRRCP